MAINDSAVVPLYQQVKDDIRAAIESGKYKTNEKIPPEPELSAEYSVSRITVRRAVEELCAEGYLVKMQGRGTFVSKPRIHRKFASGRGTASFTETCKEYGMVPGARLLNRQIVPVRKDEEAFFHVGPEALLIYIQRLRTADGQPVFLENLFLPYEPYKSLMSENLMMFPCLTPLSASPGCALQRPPASVSRRYGLRQNRHSCSTFRWASRCCI